MKVKDVKMTCVKIKLNKKGQFYILTAIIFCSVMFLLLYNKEPIPKLNPEFESLYNNYVYESPIVINNALYNNKNVTSQFRNFTSDFIGYAKEKNIDLGIFYVLKLDNYIEAVNYLKETANITTINMTIAPDNYLILNKSNNISIKIKDTTYTYNMTDDKIQFKVLLMKQ